MREILIGILIGVMFGSAAVVLAGNLNSPGAPTDPASKSYSLEDIYNRLNDGTAGTKRAFQEPGNAPGSTGHTLNEIMAEAPAKDNNDGAGVADVAKDKKFWGLTNGAWGLQTGTSNDPNLAPGNIRSGATIFGVEGKCFRLASTGQTACWDASGASIPCVDTGQDGEYQLGCLPAPRVCDGGDDGCGFNRKSLPLRTTCWPCFLDNSDGTVTDELTGLMWLKDTNCMLSNYRGFDGDDNQLEVDGRVTWQHAFDFLEGINDGTYPLCAAGHTDWRLPNINELRSLIDPVPQAPALPGGHPFEWSGGLAPNYWSSTTNASASTQAWNQSSLTGKMYLANKATSEFRVWPVRGVNEMTSP